MHCGCHRSRHQQTALWHRPHDHSSAISTPQRSVQRTQCHQRQPFQQRIETGLHRDDHVNIDRPDRKTKHEAADHLPNAARPHRRWEHATGLHNNALLPLGSHVRRHNCRVGREDSPSTIVAAHLVPACSQHQMLSCLRCLGRGQFTIFATIQLRRHAFNTGSNYTYRTCRWLATPAAEARIRKLR